jgi:hypothetical protein
MDSLDQVRHWRMKAEELCAMAANMKDRGARVLCLRIAMSYADLANSEVRIPTKPAMHSNLKPATCSDAKPAGIPI